MTGPDLTITARELRYAPPAPMLTLNQRLHWATRASRSRAWRDATCLMARSARLRLDRPITVSLRLPMATRRRRDPHNWHPTMKAVIDGLVLACVVPDDTPEWVSTTEPVLVDAKVEPMVTVVITPRPAA